MKTSKKIAITIALVIFVPILLIVLLMTGGKENVTYKLTYNGVKIVGEDSSPKNIKTGYRVKSGGVVSSVDSIGGFSLLESKSYSSNDSVAADYGDYSEVDYDTNATYQESDSLESLKVDSDYITYTYTTRVETTEYDKLKSDLAIKLKEIGGYVENSSEDIRDEYDYKRQKHSVRKGEYTLRIPKDNGSALDDILENADVIYQNIEANDVTHSYFDTESRLEAYKKELDELKQYREYYRDNENIVDLVELEREIREIEYQLDYYNDVFEELKDRISYSTYYLTIYEVEYYEDTTQRYASDILESWRTTIEDWLEYEFLEIALVMFTLLPFVIIVMVLVIVCIMVNQKLKDKNLNKNKLTELDIKKQEIDYNYMKQLELEKLKKALDKPEEKQNETEN